MSAFADKVTPCGLKLEHTQSMADRSGIENNMVVFSLSNSLNAAISTVHEPESCFSIFAMIVSGSLPR